MIENSGRQKQNMTMKLEDIIVTLYTTKGGGVPEVDVDPNTYKTVEGLQKETPQRRQGRERI